MRTYLSISSRSDTAYSDTHRFTRKFIKRFHEVAVHFLISSILLIKYSSQSKQTSVKIDDIKKTASWKRLMPVTVTRTLLSYKCWIKIFNAFSIENYDLYRCVGVAISLYVLTIIVLSVGGYVKSLYVSSNHFWIIIMLFYTVACLCLLNEYNV